MVTRPLPVQRAPSWPGWLTGWCPGKAWLGASTVSIPATLPSSMCIRRAAPTLWEPGHSAGPTTPEYLSTFSPDPKQWDVPGLKQSPGNFRPSGQPLLTHCRDSAHSSALSPGWLVRLSMPSIPQLSGGSSGPGADLQGHSESGGFSLICAHESPMNYPTSADIKVS